MGNIGESDHPSTQSCNATDHSEFHQRSERPSDFVKAILQGVVIQIGQSPVKKASEPKQSCESKQKMQVERSPGAIQNGKNLSGERRHRIEAFTIASVRRFRLWKSVLTTEAPAQALF
jgi:hypothetical protein